ncbi:MAG: hypothetical protein CVV64_08115 [Candidatus Wallbacteria bacterium HGW-Wallbacteria-1]|jgi:hypothetical protein|uniref:Uncharacterized protein n=1 Tax=Candidatus Wallbacteria bacterium HGW-Wallbacteria-1 TaxID=2013854 RepID=A0A2N1PR62_9BACT|nr:MAG: hypothetical protein CVV64_08115 [Candidatus Wallbacteria bacterium HGW-Wallbacteria-1]
MHTITAFFMFDDNSGHKFRSFPTVILIAVITLFMFPATVGYCQSRYENSRETIYSPVISDSPYANSVPDWSRREIQNLYNFLRVNGFPIDLTHSEISALSRQDIRYLLTEISAWMEQNHLRTPATKRRSLKRLSQEFSVQMDSQKSEIQVYPESGNSDPCSDMIKTDEKWNTYKPGNIAFGIYSWFPTGPAIRHRTALAPNGGTLGGNLQYFTWENWSIRLGAHKWDKTISANDYPTSVVFDILNGNTTGSKVYYGRTMASSSLNEKSLDILYHIPSQKYKRFGAYAGLGISRIKSDIRDTIQDFNGSAISSMNVSSSVNGPRVSFGLEYHMSRNMVAWLDGVYRFANETKWLTPDSIILNNPALFGNVPMAKWYQSLMADNVNSIDNLMDMDGAAYQIGVSYHFDTR